MSMNLVKLTLGGLLSVGLLAFTLKPNEVKSLEIGDQAPKSSVKMKAIDGENYTLMDLKKENGLAVVFSCNTCPFVVGSNSFAGWEVQYNELAEQADEKGVGMVFINSNEAKRKAGDSFADMKERAKDKNYITQYVLDKNSELANAFGAKTTPHVYLFNKDMKLVYVGSIDNSWDNKRKDDEHYLRNALQALESGNEISPSSTPPRGCSIKRK